MFNYKCQHLICSVFQTTRLSHCVADATDNVLMVSQSLSSPNNDVNHKDSEIFRVVFGFIRLSVSIQRPRRESSTSLV